MQQLWADPGSQQQAVLLLLLVLVLVPVLALLLVLMQQRQRQLLPQLLYLLSCALRVGDATLQHQQVLPLLHQTLQLPVLLQQVLMQAWVPAV